MSMPADLFSYERQLGLWPVAGVDEVGRGPWAGPVIACAVVLNPAVLSNEFVALLKDSKTIKPAQRDVIAQQLWGLPSTHVRWEVSGVCVAYLDQQGIAKATYQAMVQAVKKLSFPLKGVLVDGPMYPAGLNYPARALIKGDSLSPSIAAASIIAKVLRDRWMQRLARLKNAYSVYGWDQNAGYGTAHHRQALDRHGITPHHRQSFEPIKKILCGCS